MRRKECSTGAERSGECRGVHGSTGLGRAGACKIGGVRGRAWAAAREGGGDRRFCATAAGPPQALNTGAAAATEGGARRPLAPPIPIRTATGRVFFYSFPAQGPHGNCTVPTTPPSPSHDPHPRALPTGT